MTGDRTDDGRDVRDRARAMTGQGSSEATAYDGRDWLVRALRVAVSLVAVLGYALAFGAALAALGVGIEFLLGSTTGPPAALLFELGLLAVPAATFLFVALYDDADLQRPAWSGDHPPLSDAWLVALATAGVATVALRSSAWHRLVELAGFLAAGIAAYVAVPLWLARRCLRRPSWTLGALSVLLAPLVLAGGLVVLALTASPAVASPTGAIAAGAVALVGTAVPYGLAYASPGPDALAERLAGALRRVGGLLSSVSLLRGEE